MPMSVRERYEAMQEKEPVRAGQLIANFDQALEHPNREDLENFRAYLCRTCLEKR